MQYQAKAKPNKKKDEVQEPQKDESKPVDGEYGSQNEEYYDEE
jgi:hypothetical protein